MPQSDRTGDVGRARAMGPSRRLVLQGAAGLAALGLAGRRAQAASYAAPPVGAKDAKPVTLRFGTSYVPAQPMGRPVREILAKFQADYPNVSIAIEETPGNDHQTKIKLDASSDRVPDFFNYWRLDPGFGLDQIARAGRLADLTEWTKTDPAFTGLFDESSWRTASLDGKVYGVPVIMFYVEFLANKAVFDRAGVALPTDWPSLLASVKALKEKGELPWAVSIGNDSQGGRAYNYVVNRMVGNERAMRMHGALEPINVPEMVQAAEYLRALMVGYVPEDAIAIKNEVVYAKYVNANRGGLILDGSWVTATIKPEVQENLVVLEFPLLPGGAQAQRNVERDLTTLWYMSAKAMADDNKRPYVLELLRRLSSREAGKLFAEQAQVPIPMLGVEVDQDKVVRVAKEAQALALSVPANKWIPSAMRPDRRAKFEPLLGEFLAGKHEAFVDQLGRIFAG
jgi:ABC-type glycerol-3-phosphate transport system substrate-binding protein